MTTANSLVKDLRIIEFIDDHNRSWYYVQRRFLFVFWLICVDRRGFSSLEQAKQGIYRHQTQHQLDWLC